MSGTAHNTPERRANSRTRLQKLAYIRVEPDNGAIVLDASGTGIRFYAVAPFPQAGAIQFSSSLSGNRLVEATARLVWTDETKKSGGLAFSSVPAEVREQILACCSDQTPPSHSARKLKPPSNDLPLSERPQVTSRTVPELKEHRSLIAGRALAAAGMISRGTDQRPGPSKDIRKATPVKPKVHEVNSNAGSTSTALTQSGLRLALSQGSRPAPEAWKKMLGQKPIPARLATLPDNKLRWSALASSAIFQAAVAAILVAFPMLFPDNLATKIRYEVTPIAAPETEVLLPKAQPVIRAKVQPAPEVEQPQPEPPPQHVAKLLAPRQLVAPKPKPVQVANQDVPEVAQTVVEAKFEAPVAEPTRPRAPVQVGNISTGSAAPATIDKPIEKVQTGGFGDPNGASASSYPNRRADMAHFGSPALSPGPGYGNGTGGATGSRGTVVSTGFGNGTAFPLPGGSGARGTVKAGGFATADVGGAETVRPKQESTETVQAVTILDKPKPIYTEEARKLGIEGDVLVEVVFPASGGPVQVGRVLKGLGHGLDENAIRAAQQIRFKPALQDGKPVDFPAVVHIVFQVAF